MLVLCHLLTLDGTLLIGGSPLITIINAMDNSLVITSANMTEVGYGFYKYNFTSYQPNIPYCFLIECSNALQRYIASSNFVDTSDNILLINNNINTINSCLTGRWVISNNQMIMYAEDNTTELARFNLFDKDGNPTEINVYDRQRV